MKNGSTENLAMKSLAKNPLAQVLQISALISFLAMSGIASAEDGTGDYSSGAWSQIQKRDCKILFSDDGAFYNLGSGTIRNLKNDFWKPIRE